MSSYAHASFIIHLLYFILLYYILLLLLLLSSFVQNRFPQLLQLPFFE